MAQEETTDTTDNGSKKKKAPCSWSANEESLLVTCLTEERDNSNQTDTGFKPIVFTNIVARLIALGAPECGPVKDVAVVKSKYNALKADYLTVKAMLQQASGWGLDPKTFLIKCPDGVWDAYVEKHPKAKPFRKKPFPHYHTLDELFSQSKADGKGALRIDSTITESTTGNAQNADTPTHTPLCLDFGLNDDTDTPEK